MRLWAEVIKWRTETPCCCQGAGYWLDLARDIVPLSGTIYSHSPELWLFPGAQPEAPEAPEMPLA